jgi:CubicO group peptidase (beta-lactamase class C family)
VSSVDLDAVGRLESRIQAEIDSGRSLAAQYALGLHGRVVAGRSFGTATDAHRFVIFSATKTIVQFALVPETASGALELTAPVAEYIPEFGENGKDAVTVLQLLTMQGGFPLANIGPNHWGSSEGRRSRFARWSLQYPAGTVRPVTWGATLVIPRRSSTATGSASGRSRSETVTVTSSVGRSK